MVPFQVDPEWYNRTWYGASAEAGGLRPNRVLWALVRRIGALHGAVSGAPKWIKDLLYRRGSPAARLRGLGG